jgi:hypothetical protein
MLPTGGIGARANRDCDVRVNINRKGCSFSKAKATAYVQRTEEKRMCELLEEEESELRERNLPWPATECDSESQILLENTA